MLSMLRSCAVRTAGQLPKLSNRPLSTLSAAPAERISTPVYTPSLWNSLFGRSSYPRVPLNEAWPNLPQLKEEVVQPLSEAAQITTLSNGLRVATIPAHSSIASVGVFIDAGSRYESPEISGLTHFYELMSLKSTKNRSDFRLVREMLKMGANVSAASARDHLMYNCDALKEYVPAIVGTLGDVIQQHAFRLEELLEEREMYEQEYTEREKQTFPKMMEFIHEAAYLNNTLGLPLFAPLHNLDKFTPETLKQYQQTFFTPKRMVISGIGVEHEELVNLANQTFTTLPAESSIEAQPAQYTGGDVRTHVRGDTGLCHLAIAFETANWHNKDLVPMCVLQMMMGGGGSFSPGGPGKGMYSRLYSNVLNRHDWIESCSSFNSIFADSALFGIYGTAAPQNGKRLVDAIVQEFVNMTGQVTDTELNRAKSQLKSTVYMQLEVRSLKLEDLGRQIMTYGKVTTPQEICRQIDAVTAEDIQRVAKKMLQTPMSLAAFGNLSYVPRYDIIQRQFK